MVKVYFPGLNGVRAIAAFIVIFFHINADLSLFGLEPINSLSKKAEMSRHAVVLFFVLSGYLITYLLMKEKNSYKKIDIKKFYIRRIIRIWPAYYFTILLALFLIPVGVYQENTAYSLKTILLYSLFIPNFAILVGYSLPSISPLWSIGVEEQFYAAWPVLLGKTKNVIKTLLIFLLGYLAIKFLFAITGRAHHVINFYLYYFSYDTMAIGGIVAWLFYKKHKFLKWLYHPVVQSLCWIFFIGSLFLGPLNVYFLIDKEIYAMAFATIILNVSTNPSSIIKLNAPVFNYLGKISYGLYLYHPLALIILSYPLKYLLPFIPGQLLQIGLIGILTVTATILFAQLSFKYIESPILKLKSKYTKVQSTNETETEEVPIIKNMQAEAV
jgi:peptidoglycan/LPS O-acetylase OafA/YrhL